MAPARPKTPKKAKRTFAEMYVDAVRELSEDENKFVSSASVKDELGWPPDRYARVRAQLIEAGTIVAKLGGPGGMVALVAGPTSTALRVFVSYSHVDEALKVRLLKHLSPIVRSGLIEIWHDRKLVAGDEWGGVIDAKLGDAHIVLLLVSIDFIDSKYCYDEEMYKALERHDSGQAKVVPVILKSCMWQHAPFAKLQALPKDAKAISAWPEADEAMANVAEGIKLLAEELRSSGVG